MKPALASLALLFAACASGTLDLVPGSLPSDPDASYDAGYGEGFASPSGSDAGALVVPGAADASSAKDVHTDGTRAPPDAGVVDAPDIDARCAGPLAPGDLSIVELMIASQAGTGDHGEWVEVRSSRDCALDLFGLHADSPRGTRSDTADVTTDLWLLPGQAFVIADSSDPGSNHSLPGPLVTWAGEPSDVLRNSGDTVTLSLGGVVLDTVTYPSMTLTDGTSKSFPEDCPPGDRSDFTQWEDSTSSWTPGMNGTPAAPNTDVHCPSGGMLTPDALPEQ